MPTPRLPMQTLLIPGPGVLAKRHRSNVGDVLSVTHVDSTGMLGLLVVVAQWQFRVRSPRALRRSSGKAKPPASSFLYTVDDGQGGTSTATVTITVAGVRPTSAGTGTATVTGPGMRSTAATGSRAGWTRTAPC